MRIKRGDKVVVIAGKDKGKEGKVLVADRKRSKVTVEGINIVKKHQKAGQQGAQQGGIIGKEAAIDASNVMFVHNGKPTRIGYRFEQVEKNGKTINKKVRFAKTTGDVIN